MNSLKEKLLLLRKLRKDWGMENFILFGQRKYGRSILLKCQHKKNLFADIEEIIFQIQRGIKVKMKEKYYFHQMLDPKYSTYNWLYYGLADDFSDEEINSGKFIIADVEYNLIPLSQLKQYLENHPNECVYKEILNESLIDEKTKEYLKKEIDLKL